MSSKKVLLCILDGWGVRQDPQMNGICAAQNWQNTIQDFPYTEIQASEEFVGLPLHQMGNSEVGHMAIGLGRVIEQDLPRIDYCISSGAFCELEKVRKIISERKDTQTVFHVMGLLSPGGVHSHQNHMMAIVKQLSEAKINVCIHAFLDGRDTPPKSALGYLAEFEKNLPPYAKVGTVSGRYYAMDRDQRFERTKLAYEAMISRKVEHAFNNACEGIQFYYNQGLSDEFIPPFVIDGYQGMRDDDALWMANFRSDRVRQILLAFLDQDFDGFSRSTTIKFSKAVAMTEYSQKLNALMSVLFERISTNMGLSETISSKGMRQLHVAETEKYAHVTFFFNGGKEIAFPGEDRMLVPSPNVATYDLKPEMSAFEVTQIVCDAIKNDRYQFIVVNFANTDMVGHTGIPSAIEQAVRVVDQCVETIKQESIIHDWAMIITADHGNAEEMLDHSGQPHTAHTCNPVPFVLINYDCKGLTEGGTLADVAPTILDIMEIAKPQEMTGRSLCMG